MGFLSPLNDQAAQVLTNARSGRTPGIAPDQNHGITLSGHVTIQKPTPQTTKPQFNSAPPQKAPPPPPPPQPPNGSMPNAPATSGAQATAGTPPPVPPNPGGPNATSPASAVGFNMSDPSAIARLIAQDESRVNALMNQNITPPQKGKLKIGGLPIALAAAGLLFGKGGGMSNLTRGVLGYEAGQAQGLEQKYKDAEQQYATQVADRDNQLKDLDSSIGRLYQEQETAQHHRALEHAADEKIGNDIQKTDILKQHYGDLRQEAASRLGVEKWYDQARIKEQYDAQAQQTARTLQAAGIRASTAINVAQARDQVSLVNTIMHNQAMLQAVKERDSDAYNRMMSQQGQITIRTAFNGMERLMNVVNNPKLPPATRQAAAQSLAAQMNNPNSPLAQAASMMQGMGIGGATLGDEMLSEAQDSVEMNTIAPGGAGFGQTPINLNVNIPAGAAGAPTPPVAAPSGGVGEVGDVQAILRKFGIGGKPAGGAGRQGAAHAAPPPATHADLPIDAQHLQTAKQYYQMELAGTHDPEKAWAITARGFQGATPEQLQQLKAAIVGAGEPNPKNFPAMTP